MGGHGSWSVWGTLVLSAGLAACGNGAAPPPVTRSDDFQPATLSEAVLLRNRTAVENFLALGADPNETEDDGTTPLMRAVHGEAPEIAELLIAASADVSATNSYGVSALYIAASAGDAAATRLLVAAGADANSALPSGETALMTAAKSGDADVVRALLTGGDDTVSLPEIGQQWSVAQAAESAGYAVPTAPTVGTNYADVNARERLYGRTALMIAAAEGHTAIVRLLIEAGSDVNSLDVEGSSALSLARSFGHLDAAATIAAAGGR